MLGQSQPPAGGVKQTERRRIAAISLIDSMIDLWIGERSLAALLGASSLCHSSLNRDVRQREHYFHGACTNIPKLADPLHQLVPKASTIGALVNPNYPDVEIQRLELLEAASVIAQKIHIFSAGTEREIGVAFTMLVQQKTDALLAARGSPHH